MDRKKNLRSQSSDLKVRSPKSEVQRPKTEDQGPALTSLARNRTSQGLLDLVAQ